MPPKENEIGYRRNGKKQACEPCRKGKLACDHGAPFCGRCVRRKTTARCIYHPAPMTRNRATAMISPQQSPELLAGQTTQLQFPQPTNPPLFQSRQNCCLWFHHVMRMGVGVGAGMLNPPLKWLPRNLSLRGTFSVHGNRKQDGVIWFSDGLLDIMVQLALQLYSRSITKIY